VSTAGRRHALGGATALAVLLLSGCGFTISKGDPMDDHGTDKNGVTAFVRRAEETKHVEFDLRRPPTATEVGIAPGFSTASFDYHAAPKMTTVVHLPGDVQFTFESAFIEAATENSADGQPQEVRMQGSYDTLEQARDELARAAELLAVPGSREKFSQAWIDQWYDEARGYFGDDTNSMYGTALSTRGRRFGDIRSEAQVKTQPATGGVTVFYSFRWGQWAEALDGPLTSTTTPAATGPATTRR
jgi:hypothetical protein